MSKQVKESHEKAAEILDQMRLKSKELDYLIKWEAICMSKGWPLPDEHFDERDAVKDEYFKLRSHYKIEIESITNKITTW